MNLWLQVREWADHEAVCGGRYLRSEEGPGRPDAHQIWSGDADRGSEGRADLPEEEPWGGTTHP